MEGIEVDPSVLDHTDDSDYLSSGYDTSTASLTSSIHSYIFENGRRYHAYFGADRNLLPTDEVCSLHPALASLLTGLQIEQDR
jgi:hypothetical protein